MFRFEDTRFDSDFECYCDYIPLQLLLSCRVIHDEVVPLLYGRNVFKLSCPDWKRKVFQPPSSMALASLTCLQLYLSDRTRYAEDIAEVVDLFSTKCTLPKLDLSLSYNFDDPIDFRRLAECWESFSNLKMCAISLGVSRRPSTAALAKAMALQATSAPGGMRKPFPFMDLPKEIRYEVLLHTDLVVHWRKGWETDGLSVVNGQRAIGGQRVTGRVVCCGQCTPSRAICCCPQFSASFSLTCTCYHFPSAFFTVSRQFYREAQKVFYSENRFSFYGHPFDTITFFRKLRPALLGHIRFIDLQLGLDEIFLWPTETQSGHPDWKSLLTFLSQNLDLSKIILSLDAGYSPRTWRLDGCDLPEILDFYRDITESFHQLPAFRKLRGFQMFLPCFNEYEAVAEKKIMGEQYDSALQGKVPYERRALDYPHGLPYKRPEWKYWRLGVE